MYTMSQHHVQHLPCIMCISTRGPVLRLGLSAAAVLLDCGPLYQGQVEQALTSLTAGWRWLYPWLCVPAVLCWISPMPCGPWERPELLRCCCCWLGLWAVYHTRLWAAVGLMVFSRGWHSI